MKAHQLTAELPSPSEVTDSQNFDVVYEDDDGRRHEVEGVEYDFRAKQVVIHT